MYSAAEFSVRQLKHLMREQEVEMDQNKKKRFLIKLKHQWPYYLMLLPAFIITVIFCYIPMYGVVIAFQDYNTALGFHSPWVGLDNFKFLFRQPTFVRTIWNTFYIAIFKIILGIIVPVTVALLLNEIRNQKMKRIFQTLIYLPYFLSWVILAGVMLDLLSVDGIVNQMLAVLGIGSIDFLGDVDVFPWTMILSDVWKSFGYGSIIYLAALTSIDPSLYEAAVVDGAGRWKQTKYITLPLLMPTVVLMTILALGGVLNAGFDQIYNLQSPIVYETGDVIDTYVYRMGIVNAQFSVGTAVGLFKSLVSGALILISYYLADRFAGYRVF